MIHFSAFCPASLQTNREVTRALKKHWSLPKGYGMDWKHNKKFKLTERWTQIWESFAGRPYVKPKRLKTGVIHEIVKESQEVLARLNLGQIWRAHREYKEKVLNDVAHVHPVGPPKTLGELCLEDVSDSCYTGVGWKPGSPGITTEWYDDKSNRWEVNLSVTWDDCWDLRRALYRRNN
jgi:hypothetical protein